MDLRPAYVYELRSINLALLREREARAVLDGWASFLNSMTSPSEIRVVEDIRTVMLGDEAYSMPYKRYFLISGEPLEDAMASAGLRGVRVPASSIPELRIVANAPRFAVDSDGALVRCYSLLRLSASMEPGWLVDLYPIAHEIRISLRPLENGRDEAVGHERALEAELEARAREGRAIDPEARMEMEAARSAADAVASGRERLFLVRILIAIRAREAGELEGRRRALRSKLHGMIDSPLYMSAAMCTGRGPRWALGREIYAPTGTLLAFFPFAGLDIVDPTPAAVAIGQNLATGNAIVYDVFERENYNVAVFGQTGYGKSTLIKAWISRLAAADPGAHIWVFDSIVRPEYALGPDGRFEGSFAELIGSGPEDVVDVSRPQGLDPYQVFESRAAASSFVSDLAGIEEPDLRAELNLIDADHVWDLQSRADGTLRRRLEAGLRPFENLWSGETELVDRQVFVLSTVGSAAVRDAAAYLLLAWIWGNVKRLPLRERKVIVIDEGWAFVEMDPRTGRPYFPAAVEFVPEIARTGRHYNAAFVIATQRVSDMMSGPGRVMLESAATKVVLRQDPAAVDVLSGPLALSPEEGRFVVGARPGQGLLISPEGHVPFYNMLSEAEMARFTMKPEGSP